MPAGTADDGTEADGDDVTQAGSGHVVADNPTKGTTLGSQHPRRAVGGVVSDGDVAEFLRRLVRDVPDYPQPGVVFKDITPLLGDGPAFRAVISALAAGHERIDKVAGIEARGFILAAPVACALGVGFVPVRKIGKLPGPTHVESYQLEYGTAAVEVKVDAFAPGERVLLIDDVLATGGTAAATAALIRRCGAEIVTLSVLIELGFLNGRDNLPDLDISALMAI